MYKITLFLLIATLLTGVGYAVQTKTIPTKEVSSNKAEEGLNSSIQSVGHKACKVTGKKLAKMPFVEDKTSIPSNKVSLFPKDITVVIDDPNVLPRYDWDQSDPNGPEKDPIITTTLDKLLERITSILNFGEIDDRRTYIDLIDVDANGYCDLIVASPYDNAQLYLANSSGYLINKPIDTEVPLGELLLTPVYMRDVSVPTIVYEAYTYRNAETGAITWQEGSNKILNETLNTAKKVNSIAAFKHLYDQHIAQAIKHLREGELSKAKVSLDEARVFDSRHDYQRNYYTGIISHLNKKYRIAENYFIAASKMSIPTKNEKALIYYNLGLSQEAQGKKQDAKKSFEEYLSILPNGKYSQEIKNHRLK